MGAGGGGGRDRLAVDPAAWRARLDRFVRGGEAELQCRENYGRDGVEEIHRLAAEQGLFSKAYGRGRHTVLVVSREPLPNYRADLDARLEGRVQHVVMDAGAKAMVQHVLASLPQTDEPHAEQAGFAHDAHDAHDAVAAVNSRMETNRVWSRGAIPTAKAVPFTDCSHVQRRSSGDERRARVDREPDGEWEVTGVVMRRVGVVGGQVDERRG